MHGDWGLGIGDWGLGIAPNPQSPIPNPQSPIPIFYIYIYKINNLYKYLKHKKIIYIKIYIIKIQLLMSEIVFSECPIISLKDVWELFNKSKDLFSS